MSIFTQCLSPFATSNQSFFFIFLAKLWLTVTLYLFYYLLTTALCPFIPQKMYEKREFHSYLMREILFRKNAKHIRLTLSFRFDKSCGFFVGPVNSWQQWTVIEHNLIFVKKFVQSAEPDGSKQQCCRLSLKSHFFHLIFSSDIILNPPIKLVKMKTRKYIIMIETISEITRH